MTYSESIPKNITTDATSKPSSPQVVIENTSDKEIYCNLIEILPNVDFTLNGILEIEIDGITVLDNKNDSFRSYSKYPLPIGKKVQGRGEIRIFAWNKNNTDQIKCDFNIHLSSQLEHIQSVAIPLTTNEKNNAISEFENIFPLASRAVGSYHALVDMKGYKKLIVLISQPILSDLPTLVSNTFPVSMNLGYDGNLDTEVQTSSTTEKILTLSYAAIAQRNLVVKFSTNSNGVANSVTQKVDISDDGVNWTEISNQNYFDSSGNKIVRTNDLGLRTFKFVRIKVTCGQNGIIASYSLYEIYDSLKIGGVGSISFQVKNSSGEWIDYIPFSEFGTVTQTTASVVKQVGDVNTVSVSGKTYALPSSQNNFRAKYVVTTGGLTNAVDIQRVA